MQSADGAALTRQTVILCDAVVHGTSTRGGTSAGRKTGLQRTLPPQPQAQQSHLDGKGQTCRQPNAGTLQAGLAVNTVLEREIVATEGIVRLAKRRQAVGSGGASIVEHSMADPWRTVQHFQRRPLEAESLVP